jgi:hypothetical protein
MAKTVRQAKSTSHLGIDIAVGTLVVIGLAFGIIIILTKVMSVQY